MVSALTLVPLLILAPTQSFQLRCVEAVPVHGDETLRELYEGGKAFRDFLGEAVERRALWRENFGKGEALDMTLVDRARAVAGTWRLLAVAVDSCSDSVSTIPYLARLVELVDQLDMRIIDPAIGRSIMEEHRTPNGRAATPTILLLDSDFNEVGCFIERPKVLQDWILEWEGELSADGIYERKMEWYAADEGRETLEELVTMLEAASAGRTICER